LNSLFIVLTKDVGYGDGIDKQRKKELHLTTRSLIAKSRKNFTLMFRVLTKKSTGYNNS
jgi:hypothetical protein